MSEELMPCPICGSPCAADDARIACTAVDEWGDVACGYFLDDTGFDGRFIEAHNTLCRQAKVGALVEEILGRLTLRDMLRFDPNGLPGEFIVDVVREGGGLPVAEAEGLPLAALESLAGTLEESK